MTQIKVSAPAKIHLLGEHAVVYGKPAILTAINKRIKVVLFKNKKDYFQKKSLKIKSIVKSNKVIVLVDKNLKYSEETTLEEILNFTKKSKQVWKKFLKSKDVFLLKSIVQKPLDLAKIAIGETYLRFNKKLKKCNQAKIKKKAISFKLEIESEIPSGSGLGSSSAIAAAVSGSVYTFLNRDLEKNDQNHISEKKNKKINNFSQKEKRDINRIVYEVEKRVHGNPSGGDNTAVVYGGWIWFKKISDTRKVIKPLNVKLPKELTKNFLLIDTGKPLESTGEMVEGVRKIFEKKPGLKKQFLKKQEKLVEEIFNIIKNFCVYKKRVMKGTKNNERAKDLLKKRLIKIIKTGERNLESIGVVSPFVKKIIRLIEKTRGSAKICGGGGKIKGTGFLLCYHKEINKLIVLAKKINLKSFGVNLGEDGLKLLSSK